MYFIFVKGPEDLSNRWLLDKPTSCTGWYFKGGKVCGYKICDLGKFWLNVLKLYWFTHCHRSKRKRFGSLSVVPKSLPNRGVACCSMGLAWMKMFFPTTQILYICLIWKCFEIFDFLTRHFWQSPNSLIFIQFLASSFIIPPPWAITIWRVTP